MSKVTAVGMDAITEKSGHVVTPMAPSVCTTPAAPAPIPVPYPVSGTSAGGIMGPTSRTKMGGAKIGTVGGGISAVHGNEPGSLKEVVSLATGGPAPILMGAPTVLAEKGMVGVTGSPLLANRGPGPSGRTAPGPGGGPGSVPAVATLGAGNDGGDADGNANGGKDGNGGGGSGSGKGGKGDGKSASAAQDGQCSGGHPVDVITGRAYTLPAVDLELPGPLPLVFARDLQLDSGRAPRRRPRLRLVRIAWGWEIEVRHRALVVWSDEGIAHRAFHNSRWARRHVGPWGWVLRRERERFVLDTGDGCFRVFAAADERARRWRLVEIRDRNGNRIELTYDDHGTAGRGARQRGTHGGGHDDGRGTSCRCTSRTRPPGAGGRPWRDTLTTTGTSPRHGTPRGTPSSTSTTTSTGSSARPTAPGSPFSFAYDREGRCTETWGEYLAKPDASLADDLPAVLADGRTRARGIHHVRLDYHDGPVHARSATRRSVRSYFGNRHGLVDKRIEGPGVEDTRV